MILLACGLAIAAYKADPGFVRVFLVVCCLLNAAAATSSIIKRDPYAFRLKPNNGEVHDSYRRP